MGYVRTSVEIYRPKSCPDRILDAIEKKERQISIACKSCLIIKMTHRKKAIMKADSLSQYLYCRKKSANWQASKQTRFVSKSSLLRYVSAKCITNTAQGAASLTYSRFAPHCRTIQGASKSYNRSTELPAVFPL